MATQQFPEKYVNLPKISIVGKSDISLKSVVTFWYVLATILLAFPLFTYGYWNFTFSGGYIAYSAIVYNRLFGYGIYSLFIDCFVIIFILTIINLFVSIFSKLGRFKLAMIGSGISAVLLIPPYFLLGDYMKYNYQSDRIAITYFYIALFFIFIIIFFRARKGYKQKRVSEE